MRKSFILTSLIATLFSCTQQQQKTSNTTEPKQEPVVTKRIDMPAEMKQKEDGTLYFKESYLIERSSNDIDVIVTGDKIDTLK